MYRGAVPSNPSQVFAYIAVVAYKDAASTYPVDVVNEPVDAL
jgi:hypothetical protein